MKYTLTPELMTGNATIDSQHKTLIDAINKLFDACAQGKGRAEAVGAAQFLLQYTNTHFSDEEKLQLKNKYPDYANHKKYHEYFKGVVKNLADKLQKEGATVATVAELNSTLAGWLINHIKVEDKKVAKHIKDA